MRYKVAGLLKSPTGAIREAEVEALLELDDPEVVVLEPVKGHLRLTRVSEGVLVEGELCMVVEVACARCLEPTSVVLEFEICEQFRPTTELPGGPPVMGPADADDADEATLIDAQHVLDITELVRQAALVSVPLHPLCRPDCAGLCPTCGKDLNTGPCECVPEPDPRWEELRSMIEEPRDESRRSEELRDRP